MRSLGDSAELLDNSDRRLFTNSTTDSIMTNVMGDAPRKGNRVRITDGPFIDLNGVVEDVIPERNALNVRISMFGRETMIEVDAHQVERLMDA